MNKTIIIAFLAGLFASTIGGGMGLMAANAYAIDRTEIVFIHNDLQNPITRTFACHCITKRYPARLDHYIRGIRTFIRKNDDYISGEMIYVSEIELKHLDKYYDVPESYTRKPGRVGGKTVWIYIKN
ncbi:gamma-glutamylcyclotransferase [Candidatus Kaiserbacteria bacterium]|nr:gamma-glutamylcyclotransferase [Candidatus Kaiserbacteria bacterium]